MELNSRNNAPLRVALIGITGYGGMYYRQLRLRHETGEVEFVAATVINPEDAVERVKWLEENGVRIYKDYREMFARESQDLDACCIPTAISLHRKMCEAALDAGLDILVEKPLAGCVEDAQAIVERAKACNCRVAVGFQAVWSNSVQALQSAIHEGKIGKVRRIAVSGVWPRPTRYYKRNAWAGKRADRFGIVNDNPANNAMAHFLNLALLFAGPGPNRWARVERACSERMRANDIETYDTVISYISTGTDIDLFYGVSHASDVEVEPSIEVVGDSGRAFWSIAGKCSLQVDGEVIDLPRYDEADAQLAMLDSVIRNFRDGTALLFSGEDALAHVEAVHMLEVGAKGPVVVPKNTQTIRREDKVFHTIPGVGQLIQSSQEAFVSGESHPLAELKRGCTL